MEPHAVEGAALEEGLLTLLPLAAAVSTLLPVVLPLLSPSSHPCPPHARAHAHTRALGVLVHLEGLPPALACLQGLDHLQA